MGSLSVMFVSDGDKRHCKLMFTISLADVIKRTFQANRLKLLTGVFHLFREQAYIKQIACSSIKKRLIFLGFEGPSM